MELEVVLEIERTRNELVKVGALAAAFGWVKLRDSSGKMEAGT